MCRVSPICSARVIRPELKPADKRREALRDNSRGRLLTLQLFGRSNEFFPGRGDPPYSRQWICFDSTLQACVLYSLYTRDANHRAHYGNWKRHCKSVFRVFKRVPEKDLFGKCDSGLKWTPHYSAELVLKVQINKCGRVGLNIFLLLFKPKAKCAHVKPFIFDWCRQQVFWITVLMYVSGWKGNSHPVVFVKEYMFTRIC